MPIFVLLIVIIILIAANIIKSLSFKHNNTHYSQINASNQTPNALTEVNPVVNDSASTSTTSFIQPSITSSESFTNITEKKVPTVIKNNCESRKIYSDRSNSVPYPNYLDYVNCIYCHQPIDLANTIFLTNGMKLHKECYKKCLSANGIVEKDIIGKAHAFWDGYPPDWNTRKAGVLREAGYRCEECGKSGVPLTVHHIIPLTKGGSNAFDNLKALCAQCHQRAHMGHDLSRDFDTTPDYIKQLVTQAIQADKKLHITYIDYHGKQTERTIKPIRIISRHTSLILEAFCYLRKDNREFRMEHITHAELV